MKNDFCIGLTYGDPASIGPEILLKTLKSWKKLKFKLRPLVIGLIKLKTTHIGKPSKNTGIHAYKCLKLAVKLAKDRKITALVTGPVSKKAINLSNKSFIGQTDEIAKLCNVNPKKVIMIFVANDLRIALFTRHMPLKLVSSKLSKISLREYLLILNYELKKWFSIKKPKIAILGLNPHAGEGGMFGSEEKNIISPVINELNTKGLNLFGPLSPDATLARAGQNYLQNKKQEFDSYVSFYHDQSLPMFKAVAGMRGVNVTLGLPFLRVSVDHGTAFDIAGKNIASNEGLISGVRLVEKILHVSNQC